MPPLLPYASDCERNKAKKKKKKWLAQVFPGVDVIVWQLNLFPSSAKALCVTELSRRQAVEFSRTPSEEKIGFRVQVMQINQAGNRLTLPFENTCSIW